MSDLTKENLTFEQALAQLEKILNQLDRGEAPLAEAMDLYKDGLALVEILNNHLNKAQGELKVFNAGKGQEGEEEYGRFSIYEKL